MDTARRRGKHRVTVEDEIIRRREKEFMHQQMWHGAEKYYSHWNKANTKFDEWTSPRYYEDNNNLVTETKQKKEKEEKLEKRRDKLQKLLQEEQSTYEIEMMIHKNKNLEKKPITSKIDDIPTDVLKDINVGLKAKEDEKRRREAEMKLYHQWRINNPIVRQYESRFRLKDLKLSWLDQQIEKKMQKERDEEECKKIIRERDIRLKQEKEKEEEYKKQQEEKLQKLKKSLDKQIEDLKRKQSESEELRKKENEELKRKLELEKLEAKRDQEEKRRMEKEYALFNIRQHKLKLKQKAVHIQENLLQEKELILRLKQMQLEDSIQDEKKRIEIREGLTEFLRVVKEQQDLEKQRQKHLEFIFDSEAKAIYNKQLEVWNKEEQARQRLIKEVLDTVKTQVEENLESSRNKQKQMLQEREEITKRVEEYNREMENLKVEETRKKCERKNIIDEDVRVKSAKKKQQENLRLKQIDDELELIRKEEERLQQEILAIQRKQGPVRPNRSRLFF